MLVFGTSPKRSEEGFVSSWAAVKDGFEPLCDCWELKPGRLKEQPVLLTSEPSLQPLRVFLFSLGCWKYSICTVFTLPSSNSFFKPSDPHSLLPQLLFYIYLCMCVCIYYILYYYISWHSIAYIYITLHYNISSKSNSYDPFIPI